MRAMLVSALATAVALHAGRALANHNCKPQVASVDLATRACNPVECSPSSNSAKLVQFAKRCQDYREGVGFRESGLVLPRGDGGGSDRGGKGSGGGGKAAHDRKVTGRDKEVHGPAKQPSPRAPPLSPRAPPTPPSASNVSPATYLQHTYNPVTGIRYINRLNSAGQAVDRSYTPNDRHFKNGESAAHKDRGNWNGDRAGRSNYYNPYFRHKGRNKYPEGETGIGRTSRNSVSRLRSGNGGRGFGWLGKSHPVSSRYDYRFDHRPPRSDHRPPRFGHRPPRIDYSQSRSDHPPPRIDKSQSRSDHSSSRFDYFPPHFGSNPSRFPPPRIDNSRSHSDHRPPRFDHSPPRFGHSPPRFGHSPPRFDYSLPRFGLSRSPSARIARILPPSGPPSQRTYRAYHPPSPNSHSLSHDSLSPPRVDRRLPLDTLPPPHG